VGHFIVVRVLAILFIDMSVLCGFAESAEWTVGGCIEIKALANLCC
jgi:hypothetical protein